MRSHVVKAAMALGALLPMASGHGQALELPPTEPHALEETEVAPTRSLKAKALAAQGDAHSPKEKVEPVAQAAQGHGEERGEEEAPAPKRVGEDHAGDHAGDQAGDHASDQAGDHGDAKRDEASPRSSSGGTDKGAAMTEGAHGGKAAPAAKGSGLAWFAAAFVGLVVAVFVLT